MLLGGWEAGFENGPKLNRGIEPNRALVTPESQNLCEKSTPKGSKGANRLLSPRIKCKRCFHPPDANFCQNAQNIHNVNTRGGGLKKILSKKQNGIGMAGAVWRDLIGRGAFSGGRKGVSDATFPIQLFLFEAERGR